LSSEIDTFHRNPDDAHVIEQTGFSEIMLSLTERALAELGSRNNQENEK
jgi:hypothetical protein